MRSKLICFLSLIFIVSSISLFIVFNKENTTDTQAVINLINIDEYTEEEINKYFEEVKSITKENNQDNILIVISETNIVDDKATKIVAAPNNQYFIQYKTEQDKEDALVYLKNIKGVLTVEENVTYTITNTNTNATYNSWGVEATGLDTATSVANTKNLEDVVIAIIDTGLDIDLFNTHYTNKIADTYNAYDYVDIMYDNDGHGTHIAGTIAESTPKNIKILPIKVSDSTSINTLNIINAINYIVRYDLADVINMSFGSYQSNTAYYQAITMAENKDIIMVAAAGNDNTSNLHYPSSYDNTISIASVDQNLSKSWFSNYGDTIDFAAPGGNINSINGIKNGTSMAAPHVASMVGILKSYNKNYNLSTVIEMLKIHSTDLGSIGKDAYYGHGFIDIDSFSQEEIPSIINPPTEDATITNFEVVRYTYEDRDNFTYNSLTNLENVHFNIEYSDGTTDIKEIIDLEGAEILNYNPLISGSQLISIMYQGHQINLNISGIGTSFAWTASGNSLTGYSGNAMILYIPNTVNGTKITELSSNLLFGDSNIRKVIIPETITTIRSGALNNISAKNIYIPNNVINISDNAFDIDSTLWVQKNSEAHSYANDNNLDYILINPIVTLSNNSFEINDVIDPSSVNMRMEVNYENYSKESLIITDDLQITYQNGNSISAGDTYITVSSYIDYTMKVSVNVPIVVNKSIPNYTIPTGLEAYIDQKLSDINLPNNFEWMNPDTKLTQTGNITYKVRYTPEDQNTYQVVDNINVTVNVLPKMMPSYTVPTNLEAFVGQKLSEISLPNNFEWMNPNQVITTEGNVAYKAKYTPNDLVRYSVVENIDIYINSSFKITESVYNYSLDYTGYYDGNYHTIDLNLKPGNHEIKYSINNTNYDLATLPEFKEIGEYTVHYKITSDTYEDYYGSNKVIIYGISDYDAYVVENGNYLIIKDFNNYTSSLKNSINVFSTTVSYNFYNQEDKLITNERYATGYKFSISLVGNGISDFTEEKILIVLGDVYPDGKISSLDYVRIKNHIMNESILNSYNLLAGDANYDGKISALDYVRIKNHIMSGGN